VTSTKAVVDAINSSTTDLAAKLDAINTAIQTGLFDVNARLSDIGYLITLGYTNICDKLNALDNTVLQGFTLVGRSIFANGMTIALAVTESGNKVALEIDETGKLISAYVLEGAARIVAEIVNLEASLESKFDALNALLQSGLADISVKIEAGNNKISASVDGVGEEIANLKVILNDALATIDADLQLLNTTEGQNGEKIVAALGQNGELIALHLDKNGALISAQIDASVKDLVSAVNSLSTTLGEKLDALSYLLNAGLADVSVKLGEIGGTIDTQFTNMNETLGKLNTNVLNGFKLVSKAVKKNGETVAQAVSTSGENIVLEIGKNGELIASYVLEGAARVVGAIANLQTSFKGRIDALNDLLKTGLADIQVEILNSGNKVKVALKGVGEEIASLGELLEGALAAIEEDLQLLNTIEQGNGEKIVAAMNSNGQILAFHLDQNGQLISAQIKASVEELVKTINSLKTSFEEKLGALNDIVNCGFANVNLNLGNIGAEIKVQFTDMNEALDGINTKLLDGFSSVTQAVNANGETIATAIGTNGEKIALKIDKKGNLIAANILSAAGQIVEKLADQTSTLADKIEALNGIVDGGLADIEAQIDEKGHDINLSIKGVSDELDLLRDLLGDALVDIHWDIKNLTEAVDGNGKKLVKAVTKTGETISATIDANGELISIKLGDISTSLENLQKALEDQNKGLADKLDALNELLAEGFVDVTAAIGDLENSLNLDFSALGELLGGKLDALLGGMTALGEKMDSNGDKIVTAINANGEIIRAQIESSGKLLKTQLVTSTKDIVAALKTQSEGTKAIAEKLDAMNTVIETELGDIKTTIETETGEVVTKLGDINDNLGSLGDDLQSIDQNLTEGFKNVNVNLADLIKAVGKVEASVDKNTKAIVDLDGNLKDELAALQKEIEKQGGEIVIAIQKSGEAIVKSGNAIALALGKDGDLYKVLDLGVQELQDIEEAILANGKSLGDLLKAGNATSEAILTALGVTNGELPKILAAIQNNKVDLTEIDRKLGEILAISDGIYLDPNDDPDGNGKYDYIYITASVREEAESTTEVDEGLLNLLEDHFMNEPTKEQIVPATAGTYGEGTIHYHCFWKQIEKAAPFLKYCDVVTDSDKKTLLKMEKYYSESTWIVKIYDACSNGHIYGILVNDARDKDRYVKYYEDILSAEDAKLSKNWNKGLVNKNEEFPDQDQEYMGPIKVKFVSYDKTTGAFCASPSAKIYCQAGDSSEAISDKAKDGSKYGKFDNPDNTDDGWWTAPSNYSKLRSTSETEIK